jgi:hypothetical protein
LQREPDFSCHAPLAENLPAPDFLPILIPVKVRNEQNQIDRLLLYIPKESCIVRLQNSLVNCQAAKIGNCTNLYFASFVTAILKASKKPKNKRYR